ncbi:MAG: Gfo/Idh/MocA family oxidoreductase [Clostridia bacterium]|nr:Gfo/Idh/MocA family oxidoreductase [Clostridia bacterium]
MKKVRIGVMGAYRGTSMINYCEQADNAQVVAICDKWVEGLERQKAALNDPNITYYTNFEDFIRHDMDAVVLANYANEHAPFAIRAMKAGKHVFSEVLPVQTMQEAVELIETVEETGLVYAYGENYCYMPAPYEMRRLYREGKIGEFEYGEGEYIHNCETIWPSITYGEADHWRNNMYATFYCTHSLGPLIHITGLRPVSVIGLEGTKAERKRRVGCKNASFGIEMVTLENGGIIKSIHGGLYKNSVWYSVYGSHGRLESGREDAGENVDKLYVNADAFDGEYANRAVESYKPSEKAAKESAAFGHGGSDYYSMYNFVRKILGYADADTIDVYEALDMFLPGLFAYRSVLKGGVSVPIPNLRNKDEREKWRGDTACTDPKVAGEQLLPTMSTGTPQIGKEVYDKMYALWRKDFTSDDGYTNAAMTQGSKKE